MTTETTTPARAGRERACAQCGTVYRSPRNSSRYCSTACRMKACRGTAPTGGPKSGPAFFSPIVKVLLRLGFVGQIGPVSMRCSEPAAYALTVERKHAYDEVRAFFDYKGWGIITEAEFFAAIKADGIQGYSTGSPEVIERKRLQARQRTATARA